MAFIPIPQSVSLCFQFVAASQLWEFCLTGRKVAGAPTPSDLDDLANVLNVWHSNELRDLLSNQNTLRQTVATDMTVQGGPQAILTSGDAGTINSPAIPLNAPSVVSLRTDKRGRSYRGRVYVSGQPVNALNSSTDITTTLASNLVSAFAQLITDVATAGYTIVVPSKQHNGATTNPAATNEVTALVVDTHLDSQRRRLFGRGT